MKVGDLIVQHQRDGEPVSRLGTIRAYDEHHNPRTGERAWRWCEIYWHSGELECFDSLIPGWDYWDTIEVLSESR